MKSFCLCFLLFTSYCSFANLHHKIGPISQDHFKGKLSESITILNYIRMDQGQTPRGEKNFGPGSYSLYLSEKQKEIGRTRYQWKDIDIFNINDPKFQMTDIKTDYVFFVSVNRPKSDWDKLDLKQFLQLITYCLVPCHQNVSLDVSVKLYYQNGLVSEKVSHLTANRYMSPWYIPVPHLFQMRDYGLLFNEPSVYSSLYLNGFQEAIDQIYAKLPHKQTLETTGDSP